MPEKRSAERWNSLLTSGSDKTRDSQSEVNIDDGRRPAVSGWALDTESPEIVINESQKKNTTEFVNDLMKAMQNHLTGEKAKYTVADFIRLAEFKKQIEHEEVKEVVVRWVETTEEPSSAR